MSKYYNWEKEIKEEELAETIEILKKDGIIIFPTETVYGIGGNALSDSAIDRVYKAKKRPRDKAVNIILANKEDIEKYAIIKSELEQKIIEKFMPGPITLILEKKEKDFGSRFTKGDNTIGIRIPDCRIIHTILERIDFPLIAPSANISDRPSGVNVSQIIDDFKDTVDAIIDGGNAKFGLSSTIVKVENEEVVILREGDVTEEQIQRNVFKEM